jgi:hypothetical protein
MSDLRLVVEVIKGHDRPNARTFNAGKENERTVYEQKAYMHTGGAFPVEIKNSFPSLPECLEVGRYCVSPASFKAGKYGDIELDRYNLQFEKLNTNQLSKVV